MKETTYKCDLCGDSCKAEILEGIHRASDKGIVFKPPANTKIHICHRCIAYIAVWKAENTISADYNKGGVT